MLEDFLKYYSKAPNFARNRVIYGKVAFKIPDCISAGAASTGTSISATLPTPSSRDLLEDVMLRSEEHGLHVIHLVFSILCLFKFYVKINFMYVYHNRIFKKAKGGRRRRP